MFEQILFRGPKEIIDEMKDLDKESGEILKVIRWMV